MRRTYCKLFDLPPFLLVSLLCCCLPFKSLGQCGSLPAIRLSGGHCAGSVLSATFNSFPATIIWKRDGLTVATQMVNTPGPNGVTVAGGNGSGYGSHQLNNPNRIFIDKTGNLYIPDMSNSRIQKWAPGATSGVTVAGGNGTGSAANQFDRATSVFVDDAGSLYVTDQNNGRVQKWAPGAASGITVANYLSTPTAVVLDKEGNLYVSEQGASKVTKWAPGASSGLVVAGGNGYGSGLHQLSSPTGIFIDTNGNLYICDTDNNRVQKWAKGATTGITVAGGSYGSSPSQLANPLGLYVDDARNIYISDFNNYRVQKWAPGASSGVTVAGGSFGSGSTQLNQPAGISMDAACNLYVSDFYNHRVQKFLFGATVQLTAQTPGNYTATLVTGTGAETVSNSISILPVQTPQVTIATASTLVCPGTSVVFKASAVNGGTAPVFQWNKNGQMVGANTDQYTDGALADGDLITCELRSDAACVSQPTANSNTIVIRVGTHQPVNLGPDFSICEGSSVTLDAGSYTAYQWQDGSTAAKLTVRQAGEYSVQVQDACGTSTDKVVISLYAKPAPFLPRDTTFCRGESLAIGPLNAYPNYLWNTGSVSEQLQVTAPGQYWLQVQDQHNCTWKDSIVVTQTECDRRLFVPTSFTPNGDGRNDVFKPLFSGNVAHYSFAVYNRWGQVVFQTSDPAKAWNGQVNGQPQAAGAYVWTCSYQFRGDAVKRKSGTVLIIR